MFFFIKNDHFSTKKLGHVFVFSSLNLINFASLKKVCQFFYVKKFEKYPPPHMSYQSKKCPCERQ
jgi:hypothetical protein